MFKSRLFRTAAVLVILIGSAAAASAATVIHAPQAWRAARPPASGGLISLPAEGGQAVSLVYRAWMDYYGVAVPGDSQLGPGGIPLDPAAQYLFAAVAAAAAQSDVANQQSGWYDTVPGSPPNYNGSPVYGGLAETYLTSCPTPNQYNIATCGYGPTAGKQLEVRNGTTAAGSSTTPDSIYWGDGAPFTLAALAAYNSSDNMPDGYNLNRGPLVQTPLLVNGISIAFNASNLTIPPSGVRLSRSSLCGIMQGLIVNWNDPSITTDNGGSVIGNQPITVVHRSDGAGTTFILSYNLYVICAQSNVSPSNAWQAGVGTLSLNAPQQMPYPSNTVVWPAGSIAAKGASTQAGDIASTAGGIGYVGTAFVSRAGGNEAYIQNTAGNFEQATIAAIKAAAASGPWVKFSETSEIPPGYPFVKDGYLPLPSDPNAAALVSYDFGYFYQCTAFRDFEQINKLHALFKWAFTPQNGGGLTPADQIAESNGLVELPDTPAAGGGASKLLSLHTVAPIAVYKNPHSGYYVDPVTGRLATYTCSPPQ